MACMALREKSPPEGMRLRGASEFIDAANDRRVVPGRLHGAAVTSAVRQGQFSIAWSAHA